MSMNCCVSKDKLPPLPTHLTQLKFSDVTPATDFSKHFIKGTIVTKWNVIKRKKQDMVKVVIAEDDTNDKLDVYAYGKFADVIDKTEKGSTLVITNGTIEDAHTENGVRKVFIDEADQDVSIWLCEYSKPSTSTDINITGSISKRSYEYKALKDVVAGTVVNVFGVVKFFKGPNRTRGTDYMMQVSLVDPSLDKGSKLKCNCFAKNVDNLPGITKVGQIVRFHRLKISTFNDELQAQNAPGHSSLVFDGEGDNMKPVSSSSNFTLTHEDTNKVKELRDWVDSDSNNLLSQGYDDTGQLVRKTITHAFTDVHIAGYFNVVCQVIATCILEDGTSMLLRVWDGTKVAGLVMEENTSEEPYASRLEINSPLSRRAAGYVYDVKGFDDHFSEAAKVKPGDYICLHNLHAARYKHPEDSCCITPTIEFCLHRGTSYGRRLQILPPHHTLAQTLIDFITTSVPDNDTNLTDSVLNSQISQQNDREINTQMTQSDREIHTEVNKQSEIDITVIHKPSTSAHGGNAPPQVDTSQDSSNYLSFEDASEPMDCCTQAEGGVEDGGPRSGGSGLLSSVSTARSEEERCMLKTVTVIKAHHHIKRTFIKQIQRGVVPNKYRVRGRVVDYQPRTDDPRKFIKLYCETCHFLSSIPDSGDLPSDLSMPSLDVCKEEHGVKWYKCPRCKKSSWSNSPGLIGVPVLSYIYMLQFIIHDGTGWITAQLWNDNAVDFFDVTPVEMLKHTELFIPVKTSLEKMCPSFGLATSKPMVECCIMSYNTEKGVCYQLFDTSLCMHESQ